MTFEETVTNKKPEKLESINEGKFGAKLATYKNGWRAVVKTVDTEGEGGERIFRGIPLATVPFREVAFYELSKILGWQDLVPETVLTRINGVTASAQRFVPSVYLRDLDKSIFDKSDPNRVTNLRLLAHKFPSQEWQRVILMDLIANNRDRHGRNIIVRVPGPHVVAIDNSISFGKSFARYRNIFHRHLYSKAFNFLPHKEALAALSLEKLEPLRAHLSTTEVDHLLRRAEFLLEYPYRLPFTHLSKGETGVNDFPSYKNYFKRAYRRTPERQLVIAPDQGYRSAVA